MKNGSTVYYANRTSGSNADISTYSTPVAVTVGWNYFTVVPSTTKGYMEFAKYGEKVDEMWTAVANAQFFDGVINEGDVMWLDGASPIPAVETQYGNGASANAVVKDVNLLNRYIYITLEYNQNKA